MLLYSPCVRVPLHPGMAPIFTLSPKLESGCGYCEPQPRSPSAVQGSDTETSSASVRGGLRFSSVPGSDLLPALRGAFLTPDPSTLFVRKTPTSPPGRDDVHPSEVVFQVIDYHGPEPYLRSPHRPLPRFQSSGSLEKGEHFLDTGGKT